MPIINLILEIILEIKNFIIQKLEAWTDVIMLPQLVRAPITAPKTFNKKYFKIKSSYNVFFSHWVLCESKIKKVVN